MKRIVGLALALAAVAGLATAATGYRDRADGRVVVGNRAYWVWLHETEAKLELRRDWSWRARPSEPRELVGGPGASPPLPDWRAAAWGVVTPHGCRVGELTRRDRLARWEVSYRCPTGVNLRRLADGQGWRDLTWVADLYPPNGLKTGAAPDHCAREATFQRQLACRDSRNAVLKPDPRRRPGS